MEPEHRGKRKGAPAHSAHSRAGAGGSAPKKTTPHAKNERTGGLLGMVAGTGAEKKYLDTKTTNAAINVLAAANPILLNGVAQGTDATERVGRKVTWESILCRMRLGLNATTPTNSAYRIMLVVDKQANAAVPAMSDILQDTAYLTSPNNMANRARFVTLWDKKGDLTTSGDAIIIEELFLRKKFQTVYSGTAATIGSIASGALYLCIFGDAAANGLAVSGYTRLRFSDD